MLVGSCSSLEVLWITSLHKMGRTDGQSQMNRLGCREKENWFKFGTSGNLSIILEESIVYTSIE
jgi:hypothetical protein